MDMTLQKNLARRLVGYAQSNSTALADDVMKVPVSAYLDRDVWDQEVEQLFKRLPIVACLSCELPEPGTYLAQMQVGVPLLLTRDAKGTVNAFLNVCPHRGAKVVAEKECSAKGNRFSCPYHGWTFDNSGKLLGVPDPALFGEVDKSTHGLTRLQVDERLGMVFVILTPGVSMDIDEYLAGSAEYFGSHGDNLKYVGTRMVKAGHWKLVVDGHMESYHFAQLHRDSIAPTMMSNCSASDQFASHNLITFCSKTITEMGNSPEDEWRPIDEDHIQPQFHFFPGALVTQFKDAMIAQLVRPGDSPGTSTNRLVYASKTVSDEETKKLEFTAQLVEDEDYTMSYDILQGISAGGRDMVTFGRNELSAHHFHQSVKRHLSNA